MKIKRIKNYNLDLSYYILLVMYENLVINNSRKIKINKIKDTFYDYIEELENIFDMKNDISEKIIINDNDDFDTLIDKYKGIFDIVENDIILDESISEKDLESLLQQNIKDKTINIETLSSTIIMNNKIKRKLDFTKIKRMFLNYLEIEKKIEKCYSLIKEGNIDKKEELIMLLEKRNTFYYNIISKGNEYLYASQIEATSIEEEDPYNNNYPFDEKYVEIYENDEFEKMTEELEFMYSIDEILHDPYMYAIFSDVPLALSRIDEDSNNLLLKYDLLLPLRNLEERFDNLYTNDIRENTYETNSYIYTTRKENEKYFFMVYIKKLEELKEYFNNTMEYENTKYRLIYLLDDYKTFLLDDNNFEKELLRLEIAIEDDKDKDKIFFKINQNEIRLRDLDEFDWWKNLAIASIEELFNNQDKNIKVKKLALINTYYSLTNDRDIIDELMKYNNQNNFFKYYSIIRNNGYQKTK